MQFLDLSDGPDCLFFNIRDRLENLDDLFIEGLIRLFEAELKRAKAPDDSLDFELQTLDYALCEGRRGRLGQLASLVVCAESDPQVGVSMGLLEVKERRYIVVKDCWEIVL